MADRLERTMTSDLNDPPTSLAPRARMWRAMTLAGLVVGVILRWIDLGGQSVWFDEGYSHWMSSLSPGDLVKTLENDVGAPFYYLLLRYWQDVFGESEFALRSLSAVMSTATLVMFWPLARRWLDDPRAIAAAVWIFALSVFQIQYAKEARFYALMSFEAILALYALMAYVQSHRKRWLGPLVGCMALMLYTHNAAVYYVGALNLAWLIADRTESRGKSRGRVKRLLLMGMANVMVVLLYVPWLPILLDQIAWAQGRFWALPPTWNDVARVIAYTSGAQMYHISRLMYELDVKALQSAERIAGIVTVITLILSAITIAMPASHRRRAIALAGFSIAPILGMYLQSHLSQPVFVDRLFIASSITLPILLAGSLASRRRIVRWMVTPAMGLMLLWSAWSAYGFETWEVKENWRGVEQYVSTLPTERTLLVFVANEGQLPFDYYAKRSGNGTRYQKTGMPAGFFDLYPPQPVIRVLEAEHVAPLLTMMQSGRYDRIVLIYSHEWFSDPARLTERALRQHWIGGLVQDFHDVTVEVFTPRSRLAIAPG